MPGGTRLLPLHVVQPGSGYLQGAVGVTCPATSAESRPLQPICLRRDLHDGLGAQLAGLNVQAGALRRLIPQDPDAAEEVVVELREELRSAISDIRRLVYDLRPPALDDLGLVEALRQLAARYGSEDEQLSVSVEAPKPFRTSRPPSRWPSTASLRRPSPT